MSFMGWIIKSIKRKQYDINMNQLILQSEGNGPIIYFVCPFKAQEYFYFTAEVVG